MDRKYTKVLIEDMKQVRLLKLLHEGSLPLSKVRIKMKDKQPQLVADKLSQRIALFIQLLDNDWFKSELMWLFFLEHRKTNVMTLPNNIEICKFVPNKENARYVVLKVYADCTTVPGKMPVSNSHRIPAHADTQ